MSDKIYIVEAYFDGYDSSWSDMIGSFTDRDVAEKVKDKWNKFYKDNITMFDGLDHDSEDEDELNKYYRMQSEYGEIKQFRNADVTEVTLNIDNYSKSDSRTKQMSVLITEWERDYKLNDILK